MVSPVVLQGIISQTGATDAKRAALSGRQRRLTGDILSHTLASKEGVKAFKSLQKLNPNASLQLKQALRTDNQADIEQFIGTTKIASKIIEGGGTPQDVQKWLSQQAILLQETGNPLAQKFVDAVQALQNPQTQQETLQNLLISGQAFGGVGEKAAKPSEQRSFEALIKDFSSADKVAARRRKAGLDARAVGSAGQTITELGTVEQVAETEKILAAAKETGTLGAKLVLKPQIERVVTLARKKASAEGETFTDLRRAKAALPGLRDTVGQLKELATLATSTLGGRVFDVASKELGFGSTKGANARAKFIAIVNNQVLPLLKPTFGGSFSVAEGQELKATMGDPDGSPEEKLAQLNAFIDQKERDILSKSRELGAVDVIDQGLLSRLPAGTVDNGDGTFTLPTGEVVEPE